MDSVATVHIILAVEAEFMCSLPMELIADCSRVDHFGSYPGRSLISNASANAQFRSTSAIR